MRLSKRHGISIRTAGLETSRAGVGITVTARKYWRYHFRNDATMQGSNEDVNDAIAMEYHQGEPVHRFPLRSGEIGEIRKSRFFYFVAAIRSNGRHDVITMQPAFKQAPAELSKKRLTQEWLEKRKNRMGK